MDSVSEGKIKNLLSFIQGLLMIKARKSTRSFLKKKILNFNFIDVRAARGLVRSLGPASIKKPNLGLYRQDY